MITLCEATHVYTDTETGRIIPDSTTGLLRKLGYADENPFFDEFSCRRGNFTHAAIHYHAEDDLDEETVDPVVMPYLTAAVKFLIDTGFVITRSEFIVYSEKWDFASKIDFEGYYPASPSLLYFGDWKTGNMPPWVRYQLALEQIAHGGYRRRVGVNLKKDGKYKAVQYKDPQDVPDVLYRLKQYKEAL